MMIATLENWATFIPGAEGATLEAQQTSASFIRCFRNDQHDIPVANREIYHIVLLDLSLYLGKTLVSRNTFDHLTFRLRN